MCQSQFHSEIVSKGTTRLKADVELAVEQAKYKVMQEENRQRK